MYGGGEGAAHIGRMRWAKVSGLTCAKGMCCTVPVDAGPADTAVQSQDSGRTPGVTGELSGGRSSDVPKATTKRTKSHQHRINRKTTGSNNRQGVRTIRV
ncbi:hypothetical protein Vretimale_1734 [Volvox reticuliferus]|uniref:Uncharacterized protein n=1 Tax=Volvox reticuliferus TaxID=1737510 RepID=A0A8J4FZP7_9CHLO|nr:hypothetical protein Vretifemale_15375 [Volvox reticuliferus]GIL95795.1 hypothetical protein Vretimale_1734 [Volvox reticuliferus]